MIVRCVNCLRIDQLFNRLPRKHKAIFVMLFFTVQLMGYFAVSTYYQQVKTTYLQWGNEKLSHEYDTVTGLYRSFFRTLFEQHLNNDDVKNIISSAIQSESQNLNRLRQKLFTNLDPVYQNLREIGVRQFQVHLPGNIVLLRMHRPDLFADDLSLVRETVAYVDQHQKAVESFEQGRTFTGIRFVYPLFDARNKFIGSAEISASADILIHSLGHIYSNLQLLVDRSITDAKVDKTEKSKYHTSQYSDRLLVESTTSDKPFNLEFDNSTLAFIADKSSKNESFSFSANNYQQQHGIVSFLNLRNSLSGNSVGYLASYSISPHLQQLNKSYLIQLLICFITFSVLFIGFVAIYLQKKALIERYYYSEIMHIPNRQALLRDLIKIEHPSLALININEFKNINDIYGIHMGNDLLLDFANRAKANTGKFGYKIFHLGADEIAILGEGTIESNFNQNLAKLQNKLEEHVYIYSDKEIDIELNITIGIMHGHHQVLEKADLALRDAKKRHQDLIVFDEEMDLLDIHSKNLTIFRKIKYALNQNNILSYYQPIVDKQGKIIKREALVRMLDGDKVLTPFHFLDVAVKTRYYHDITRLMLSNAFEILDQHSTESVSVNILADDILNASTVAYILEKLSSNRYAGRIVFEIVESQSIHGIPEVQTFIQQIKLKGALIAVDDFGSGYSNFSYITTLRPDYLKIDGSLIKNLPEDSDAQKVVRTIILFAQQLNIKTIAEFVHSEEVLQFAIELGIDEFQGFHTGKPLPFKSANTQST